MVVTIAMTALIGFTALAIDVSNLYVARNELQNASDAGALAGTRCLYNTSDSPSACNYSGAVGDVNTNTNQIAFDVARANRSQKIPVDVNWAVGTNGADVQRGHWSFTTRTFTPNDSTIPAELWNVSVAELDADTNFINAVKVTARRQATPVAAFFAQIFGTTGFEVAAEAVAWIGYAATINPGDAYQPIALCKQKLLNDQDEYSCNVGRFIPSSDNPFNSETGGWTNFEQSPDSCPDAANANDVVPLVCADGNPHPLEAGLQLSVNNGQMQNVFQDLTDCWTAATDRTTAWNMTLPVVDCVDNNIAPCSEMVGAVNVNVIWIQNGQPGDSGELGSPTRTFDCTTGVDNNDKNAPCQMEDWDYTQAEYPTDNISRWNSFATHFNLQVPNGEIATWEKGGWRQKTIYFKPDCTYHEPTGNSGGENFGILAKYPRLVQ